MDFGILLDDYAGDCGHGNYAVTFRGTLAECDAQELQDGQLFGVSKSAYKAPKIRDKTMRDALGTEYAGEIVRFQLRGDRDFGRHR